MFEGIRYVLMDIEGTLSDINFVRNIMFPYSAKHLHAFLEGNKTTPAVAEILEQTNEEELLGWIEKDVKHPLLKKIQGMIWKKGFEDKHFEAPLYPDVLPTWKKWRQKGLNLGIYSSGSVQAQKLFFKHTNEGDLLNYLSHHFDLSVGPKKEAESYTKISQTLEVPPSEILFLTDIESELEAATKAGFNVRHIVREGTGTLEDYEATESLLDIPL